MIYQASSWARATSVAGSSGVSAWRPLPLPSVGNSTTLAAKSLGGYCAAWLLLPPCLLERFQASCSAVRHLPLAKNRSTSSTTPMSEVSLQCLRRDSIGPDSGCWPAVSWILRATVCIASGLGGLLQEARAPSGRSPAGCSEAMCAANGSGVPGALP